MLPTRPQSKCQEQQEIEEQVKTYLAKGLSIHYVEGAGYKGKNPSIKDFTINGNGSNGVRKKPSLPK